MGKRGQLSIFIIIGVIIVLLIGLSVFFLSMNNNEQSSETTLSPQQATVKATIDACLRQTLEAGVVHISDRGGYYKFPEQTKQFNNVAYYFNEGKVVMPTLETIQDQLALYVEDKMPECIEPNNFNALSLEQGDINAKIIINNNNVQANIDYPIIFSNQDQKFTLDKFQNTLSVRLGEIHEFLTSHMNNFQVTHPQEIVISDYDEFAKTKDYYYYIIDWDNPNMVFIIKDENTKLNNKDHTFIITNNYDWQEIEIPEEIIVETEVAAT
jgi:hypothetical protein